MSLSFRELEKELSEAPQTWVPALLRAIIKRADEQNVFKPGGLLTFVASNTTKTL